MKKLIMVVVMVALFAGAVGVGVHVMNKEAHAANYVIKVVEGSIGVQDIWVRFRFDPDGENEVRDLQTGANGEVTKFWEDDVPWEAEYLVGANAGGWNVIGDNPVYYEDAGFHCFEIRWDQGR